MGVPAFFRWICKKCPKLISYAVEEEPNVVNGESIPINTATANPNAMEFDNLYLDMNCLVHPCCHPEGRKAPETVDAMMVEIFKLFAVVRPRKLVYMAIDGVAPRAKMNQQRSRRFRSARDADAADASKEEQRLQMLEQGVDVSSMDKVHAFDSNVITPGTEFMQFLSECLRYYIHDRLNNDAGWKGVKVVLSDAGVPGEGEHKIMEFIRRERADPAHDPNTAHVLYGADADLIMLGLATHEANFSILREEFQQSKKTNEDQMETGIEKKKLIFVHIQVMREYLKYGLSVPQHLPFEWDLDRAIDDWVFMCFFVGNDFLPHLPSLEIREGAIDQLVEAYKKLLPRMGGYLTANGNVDLSRVQLLLTDVGKAEDETFRRRRQDEQQQRDRRRLKRKDLKVRKRARQVGPAEGMGPAYLPVSLQAFGPKDRPSPVVVANPRQAAYEHRKQQHHMQVAKEMEEKKRLEEEEKAKCDAVLSAKKNKRAAARLRKQLMGGDAGSDKEDNDDIGEISDTKVQTAEVSSTKSADVKSKLTNMARASLKRTLSQVDNSSNATDDNYSGSASSCGENMDSDASEEPDDTVRLWEEGWKTRYYKQKFDIEADDIDFKRNLSFHYIEGLCWVMKYYYQGVPSWKWYYPYHYAPFASDLLDIGTFNISFSKTTKPFRPLEQLMGVFPPRTGKNFVPTPWYGMMHNPDSPILDFYPTSFDIDMNGKKFEWQGVALLPFIKEDRLLSALEPVYDQLTPFEKERNAGSLDVIMVNRSNPLFEYLCSLYEEKSVANDDEGSDDDDLGEIAKPGGPFRKLDPKLSQGMAGLVAPEKLSKVTVPGSTYQSCLSSMGLGDIRNCQVISACFQMPQYDDTYEFMATWNPKATEMPAILAEEDVLGRMRTGNGLQPRMTPHDVFRPVSGGGRTDGQHMQQRGGGGYRGGYQQRGRGYNRGGYHGSSYDDSRNNTYNGYDQRRGRFHSNNNAFTMPHGGSSIVAGGYDPSIYNRRPEERDSGYNLAWNRNVASSRSLVYPQQQQQQTYDSRPSFAAMYSEPRHTNPYHSQQSRGNNTNVYQRPPHPHHTQLPLPTPHGSSDNNSNSGSSYGSSTNYEGFAQHNRHAYGSRQQQMPQQQPTRSMIPGMPPAAASRASLLIPPPMPRYNGQEQPRRDAYGGGSNQQWRY